MLYIKRVVKSLGCFIALVLVVLVVYSGTAQITAQMAGDVSEEATIAAKDISSKPVIVYLVMGLLHADIAVPATQENLNRFPFLRLTDLPLDNPNLKFLTFGWGAKAFYTTAGSYWDIEFTAVVKAIAGDKSVMRVVGAGELVSGEDVVSVKLTAAQFDRLLTFIGNSFARPDGKENILSDVHLQKGDAFFEAKGGFNVFNPCNQWVNEALRYAGVPLGKWTPTTQSLVHSLNYFSVSPTVQP